VVFFSKKHASLAHYPWRHRITITKHSLRINFYLKFVSRLLPDVARSNVALAITGAHKLHANTIDMKLAAPKIVEKMVDFS
jgi:hypothetical protein